MNKNDFLSAFKTARDKWEATITVLVPSQFDIIVNQDGWTVKDVISHCTWFEVEMVKLIETKTFAGSNLWLLPINERNTAILIAHKDDEFTIVLRIALSIREKLVGLIASLSNEDLQKASNFQNMPPDWVPWQLIAENTFEHYGEHIIAIKNALA